MLRNTVSGKGCEPQGEYLSLSMVKAGAVLPPEFGMMQSADLTFATALWAKFTVNRASQLPPGLKQIQRSSDRIMDQHWIKEAAAMGRSSLSKMGRIREGRRDAGNPFTPVGTGLANVQASGLRVGLSRTQIKVAGQMTRYYLDETEEGMGWYERNGKYTACLRFIRTTAEEAAERTRRMSSETLGHIRFLAKSTWAYCHGWDNTNLPCQDITLNYVTILEGRKPEWATQVRSRFVGFGRVQEAVSEETERRESDLEQVVEVSSAEVPVEQSAQ